MTRREFLHLLALASAAGLAIDRRDSRAQSNDSDFYELPPFGNVGLLHFTDCHAQLLPIYYREPDTNLGAGFAQGKPPHLTGEALLREFNIPRGSSQAHAFTCLDFAHAAQLYGKVGGFAHLATLVEGCARSGPGRCCWTAATPGRDRPPRCGHAERTWSRRACARRRRDDGALGIHLRRGARARS